MLITMKFKTFFNNFSLLRKIFITMTSTLQRTIVTNNNKAYLDIILKCMNIEQK